MEIIIYDFFAHIKKINYNENLIINYQAPLLLFFLISAYNKNSIKSGMFIMAIAADLLQSLVPISQFNKGQAAKIFDRLHSERELIVLKNNQPSAIILSPEEYTRLTEIEEDYFLLLEANKRMEDNGNNKTISMDSVMSNLGVSEEELLDTEDVDIE